MGPTGEMIISDRAGRESMPQVPAVNDGPETQARAMPRLTWNGTLVNAADTQTYRLHLFAFPCEKCNGPVIAGSLGVRRDEISRETDIRKIGAACIACGSQPELLLEPSVGHCFRPVEWRWPIKNRTQPAGSVIPSLPPDLP
jgi:hypothetical protein